MGLLSIVTSALTLLGVASAAALSVQGQWQPLIEGGELALGLLGAIWLATVAGSRLDAAAARWRTQRSSAAWLAALAGNLLPVATLFIGTALAFLLVAPASGSPLVVLAWSYVVATAPALLIAMLAPRATHTLLGLRAFGAQIGYILLVVVACLFKASPAVWAPLLTLWAVVPMTMGWVMALGPPDVLRAVRV